MLALKRREEDEFSRHLKAIEALYQECKRESQSEEAKAELRRTQLELQDTKEKLQTAENNYKALLQRISEALDIKDDDSEDPEDDESDYPKDYDDEAGWV